MKYKHLNIVKAVSFITNISIVLLHRNTLSYN